MRTQKLAVAMVCMAAAASGMAQPLAVRIRVVDNYGAPKNVTSAAQKEAAHVLAVAGVRIDWQEGPTPGGLTLYLVERRTVPTSGDALGYALIAPTVADGCDCAYLLYPAIERNAAVWQAEVSTILGAAMAHEIGHVLLHSIAHSPSGIMTAGLGYPEILRASRHQLDFTAEEAACLRSQVGLRSGNATRDNADEGILQ